LKGEEEGWVSICAQGALLYFAEGMKEGGGQSIHSSCHIMREKGKNKNGVSIKRIDTFLLQLGGVTCLPALIPWIEKKKR